MGRCPNCGAVLGCFDGTQHGCMEGSYETMYGREICPVCRKGCYPWRIDHSPGQGGYRSGTCCRCGASPGGEAEKE
ncbi:MAG TPA: hypothetical protein ENK47_04130 [Euryarchaeota archaeon]|nr:hypothetical protein [Euryarchaeota archaeon]